MENISVSNDAIDHTRVMTGKCHGVEAWKELDGTVSIKIRGLILLEGEMGELYDSGIKLSCDLEDDRKFSKILVPNLFCEIKIEALKYTNKEYMEAVEEKKAETGTIYVLSVTDRDLEDAGLGSIEELLLEDNLKEIDFGKLSYYVTEFPYGTEREKELFLAGYSIGREKTVLITKDDVQRLKEAEKEWAKK